MCVRACKRLKPSQPVGFKFPIQLRAEGFRLAECSCVLCEGRFPEGFGLLKTNFPIGINEVRGGVCVGGTFSERIKLQPL